MYTSTGRTRLRTVTDEDVRAWSAGSAAPHRSEPAIKTRTAAAGTRVGPATISAAGPMLRLAGRDGASPTEPPREPERSSEDAPASRTSEVLSDAELRMLLDDGSEAREGDGT